MSAAETQSDGERYLVNKAQLSQILGVSESTLTKWIAAYADFPVENRGSHGVAYEFDVRKVKAWIDRHEAEAEGARQAEQERVAQLKLEFIGDDGLGLGEEGRKLTPKEEQELIAARMAALRLSREQGQILNRADVEESIGEAFRVFREEVEALPQKMAREFALSRQDINWLDTELAAALQRLANRLRDEAAYRDQPKSSAA